MRRVRAFVGEGGIGLVVCGDRERVGGTEVAKCQRLVQIIVAHEARPSVFLRLGLEEHELNLIAFAVRHRVHDVLGDVEGAAGGLERLIAAARPVHGHDADDEVTVGFHAFAKHRDHLVDGHAARSCEDALHTLSREAGVAELGGQAIVDLSDLAVGDGLGLGPG